MSAATRVATSPGDTGPLTAPNRTGPTRWSAPEHQEMVIDLDRVLYGAGYAPEDEVWGVYTGGLWIRALGSGRRIVAESSFFPSPMGVGTMQGAGWAAGGIVPLAEAGRVGGGVTVLLGTATGVAGAIVPLVQFGRVEGEAATPFGTATGVAGGIAPLVQSGRVEREITVLFAAGTEEVFEDGMESEFSKALRVLVRVYGEVALEVLARHIIGGGSNEEVGAEALRWLGHMQHPPTYYPRLWLLERSLFCESARVRDGALLGLASLNDPVAIPYLKKAIVREKVEELREDMEQVLDQLQGTMDDAIYAQKGAKG